MRNDKWFMSSDGEGGLAATIGGLSVVGIGQAIAQLAGMLGYPVESNDIAMLITYGMQAVGAIIAGYGIIRKIAVRVKG